VLTLPNVAAGAPDEITAQGQVIHLGPAGESGREPDEAHGPWSLDVGHDLALEREA
jgi:hypothetical protein